MTSVAETRWRGDSPSRPSHVVVVAPHPDDEVLGCGITLSRWQRAGSSIVIVGCTDGESSHPRSNAITQRELRERRSVERWDAFDALGLDPVVQRLGLPDGRLGEHVEALAAALVRWSGVPDVVLISPWEHDDHPDHQAAARAADLAAARWGGRSWHVPIWGKVRPPRPFTGRVATLELGVSDRQCKQKAVSCYATQLVPVGAGPHDGPVIHPDELDAMLDGTEVLLR